jgi:hypothetical protein
MPVAESAIVWLDAVPNGRVSGGIVGVQSGAAEIPGGAAEIPDDPGALILTCANCDGQMDERKCKLICACGYFLSCSDYY